MAKLREGMKIKKGASRRGSEDEAIKFKRILGSLRFHEFSGRVVLLGRAAVGNGDTDSGKVAQPKRFPIRDRCSRLLN